MGDRYYWTQPCPKCGKPMDVAYAESCGITSVMCYQCSAHYDYEETYRKFIKAVADYEGKK